MKKSLVICCFLLWGCAVPPNQKIEAFGTIIDDAKSNRLVLRFVQVNIPLKGEGKAYAKGGMNLI